MCLTVQNFRDHFPQFASVTLFPDAFLDIYLQETRRQVNFTYMDPRGEDAHCYLMAHAIELSKAERGMGVSAVHAGPAGLTFLPISTKKSDLEATAYGRRFLAMVTLSGPGAMVLQ